MKARCSAFYIQCDLALILSSAVARQAKRLYVQMKGTLPLLSATGRLVARRAQLLRYNRRASNGPPQIDGLALERVAVQHTLQVTVHFGS